MKKILLVAIASAMLLSNVAFASTKTTNTKTKSVSTVEQNNVYHLCTQDPRG